MSGLLRRLRRRRPATADETRVPTPASSEPAGAPAETPAEPGGGQPVPARDDQATEVLPRTGDQPAAEPAEPAAAPESGAAPQPGATPESGAALRRGATPESGAALRPGATPESSAALQPAATPQPGATPAVAASPVVPRDLPAGVDPGQLELGPAPSARRGKLRRRLRYLRRVRELLLRDLGGFAYEVHRTAGGTPQESHRRLAASKAERIATLDVELRGLESRLSEPHAEPLIREPGIGGTCPECGELHASDARYCSRCGMPLDAKARALRDAAIASAAAAHPTTGSHAVTEPGPASVLWAAGPRPRAHAATAGAGTGTAEPEPSRVASVTSQWLSRDQPTVMGKPVEGADPPAGATPDAPPAPAGATDEPPVKEAEPASPAAEAPAAEEPKIAPPVPKPAAEEAPAAKPKRAPRPRKPPETAEAEQKGADFDANPNGRRDEDEAPPVPSGDPLPSRGDELP